MSDTKDIPSFVNYSEIGQRYLKWVEKYRYSSFVMLGSISALPLGSESQRM
ncbi:hypothetical protein HMPREF0293_1438 [Corynebacterium glucuronolyticum ATCC 51866]|uniref:Uncharacterized protein n=1 Tax=Corynebacterium glucuronolyticum ATCC 51866 TaxID=548478 RepID=A0ABP2DWZ0_9CORY|nr:hypothetical protein HMPREF0293_1438 [Corynebacterium glucuronolyticum ATCC 51866]